MTWGYPHPPRQLGWARARGARRLIPAPPRLRLAAGQRSLKLATEFCNAARKLYRENDKDTPDMIVKAYKHQCAPPRAAPPPRRPPRRRASPASGLSLAMPANRTTSILLRITCLNRSALPDSLSRKRVQ